MTTNNNIPSAGTIDVVLHPGDLVTLNQSTLVSFGVPFPKCVISDVSTIRVLNAQYAEIPADVTATTLWRTIGGADPCENSVRSALVYVSMSFSSYEPVTVKIAYGGVPRSRHLNSGEPNPETTWVLVPDYLEGDHTEGYDQSVEQLKEPKVWATLPPDWMSKCAMRTRTTPWNSNTNSLFDMSGYDNTYYNYSHTAVNDVAPTVLENEKLDMYRGGDWLFDRVATYFGLYIRKGELKWLKHAHRAAQFYSNHLSESGPTRGAFDLSRNFPDHKYSYGGGLLIAYMLTGGDRYQTKIVDVGDYTQNWDYTYTNLGRGRTWTERHLSYSLAGSLEAYLLTGEAQYATFTQAVFNEIFRLQQNHPNGIPYEGGVLHPMKNHEFIDGELIASPWMSALLVDAVMRYYIHSGDVNALTFMKGLGDHIVNYGLYETSHPSLSAFKVPWYLCSSYQQYTDSGQFGDVEHNVDVFGVLARANWAYKQLQGTNEPSFVTAMQEIYQGLQYLFDYWTRNNPTKPKYRLQPARKYSWWFGTTHDLDFLLSDLPLFPTVQNEPPVYTAVVVTPNPAYVVEGGNRIQFTATPVDQYGEVFPVSDPTVTWSVNSSGNGSIDSKGLFTSNGQGTFLVSATIESLTGQSSLHVTETPVLTSIEIMPSDVSMVEFTSQQFRAKILDQFGQPFAATVTWSTTDPGGSLVTSGSHNEIADYTGGEKGGPFAIAATSGAVSGSTTVTLTATPILSSLSISPQNPISSKCLMRITLMQDKLL